MIGCSHTSSLESVRNLKVDCSTNVAFKSSAINRYNELVKFLLNRHGMLVFLRIPNNLDLFLKIVYFCLLRHAFAFIDL